MTVNIYGKLKVTRADAAEAPRTFDSFAGFMRDLLTNVPTSTIAITDDATDAHEFRDGEPVETDYSIWLRFGPRWRFAMIGGTSLDDTIIELIDVIRLHEVDEVRLCVPGGPAPRALAS